MTKSRPLAASPGSVETSAELLRLGQGRRGLRGSVVHVDCGQGPHPDGDAAVELERRLLEIGFVEGATVEILHEGFIRRDPIAVRLDDMCVALRRQEAHAILVRVWPATGPTGRRSGS